MTALRLADAGLVVFSAISLDDAEMSALEACGRPAYLVVPSDKHRLDAKTWKDRYPGIRVVAPEGARAKVEETVAVDTVTPSFDDPDVQFVTVPGTRGRDRIAGAHPGVARVADRRGHSPGTVLLCGSELNRSSRGARLRDRNAHPARPRMRAANPGIGVPHPGLPGGGEAMIGAGKDGIAQAAGLRFRLHGDAGRRVVPAGRTAGDALVTR